LSINADYSINKSSRKYSKDKVCGIDTGIRHPVTLYDGNKTIYLSMDDKTTRKIHYLERRIRRLQHYRDIKYSYNKEHDLSTHSNNIIKITKKIGRLYRKITNIKKFWIQNRCKEIATTYSKICVDRFEQPINKYNKTKPPKALRKINYANRFHKMYYFNEFLKHDCIKYGCEYIESPEDTTRTCSICGYVNDHLPLNKTHLICAKCSNVIERDMNASRNCYYYLLDNV
jgi:putative transposase